MWPRTVKCHKYTCYENNTFCFWVRLSQKLKFIIVITSCPLLKFHISITLNYTTEFDERKQEGKTYDPLPSLCYFWTNQKSKDGYLNLWLVEIFLTSLKLKDRIQQSFSRSKISTSSTKFLFFGPIWKPRWLPWTVCQQRWHTSVLNVRREK